MGQGEQSCFKVLSFVNRAESPVPWPEETAEPRKGCCEEKETEPNSLPTD